MKQLLCCLGAALIFLCLVHYAEASVRASASMNRTIKCYQCNSFYDEGCADYFDNRTYPLRICPSNAVMCRKIIQETYYDGKWDVRYIRQCAFYGEVGPAEGRWCKERMSNPRVKVKYCHCDNKDGCNTASSTQIHLTVFLPLLFTAILYFNSWFRSIT